MILLLFPLILVSIISYLIVLFTLKKYSTGGDAPMKIQMVVALFNNEFPDDKRYTIALNIYSLSIILIFVMVIYTKNFK